MHRLCPQRSLAPNFIFPARIPATNGIAFSAGCGSTGWLAALPPVLEVDWRLGSRLPLWWHGGFVIVAH